MAKKNRWFMPTNTENLRMIIAQGLISSPAGFSDYYIDVLQLFNGYIPFFKNKVQANILQYVCSEEEDLVPCILECNLKIISGSCKAIKQGKLIDCNLNTLNENDIDILLIPAPLPISCILNIIFKDTDSMKNFKNDASLYSNVPLNNIKMTSTLSDQKLFKPTTDSLIDTQLKINTLPEINFDYKKVYAYGGMLANLFYYAKNGKKSQDSFEKCYKDIILDETADYSLVLNNLHIEEVKKYNKYYNKLLNIAINKKDFKEEMINYLELESPTRAKEMINFEQSSDGPISEKFEKAETVHKKILLMLFIREDSDSLMDYHLEQFTEEDYINFAMLFGIRDKFIKIPKFIKEFRNLQSFVSTQMALYAHKQLNNDISIKQDKVITFFEMLKSNRFKEYIAKELKIENCFRTVIPKSDYTVVGGKPIFSGIVMPKFELLEDEYFKYISKIKLYNYDKYIEKYLKIK
jgi:hypothetical protein